MVAAAYLDYFLSLERFYLLGRGLTGLVSETQLPEFVATRGVD